MSVSKAAWGVSFTYQEAGKKNEPMLQIKQTSNVILPGLRRELMVEKTIYLLHSTVLCYI